VAADRLPGAWVLSPDGIDGARRLGLRLRDFSAGRPVAVESSTERKAIETADALGLGDVHTDERLCEVIRPWHDDEESFRAAIQTFFTGLQSTDGTCSMRRLPDSAP
jgi:broad specificity phosphatase PhoE